MSERNPRTTFYAVCDAHGIVSLKDDWPKNATALDGLLSFARGTEEDLRAFLAATAEAVGNGKYVIPDVADEDDQVDAYAAFLDWVEGLRGKGYDHLLVKKVVETDPPIDKIEAICEELRAISDGSLADVHTCLCDAGFLRSAILVDEARGHISNAINALERRRLTNAINALERRRQQTN